LQQEGCTTVLLQCTSRSMVNLTSISRDHVLS
jgi:hypothetical protein